MSTVLDPPAPPSPPPPGPKPGQPDAAPTPLGRRRGLRAEAIDVIALGLLAVLGLYGFDSAYGGVRYLVAGVVGLVVGSAVAWWGARTRQAALVVAAVALLGYFLFGGVVAVPETTLGGVLPMPETVGALVDGAVQGWARLLTSEPPVGSDANLLAVPYVLGLLAGVLQVSVALRSRRPMFALVFPIAVLVVSILFGTQVPASLALQGAIFAVVALWWASHVQRDRRLLTGGATGHRRLLGAVAMLVGAALVVGTLDHFGLLPGADRPRYVLRDVTDPPLNPEDFPSPLNSYRRYTNGTERAASTEATDDGDRSRAPGLGSTPLFEIEGLPSSRRLRLAVLDTYQDGIVYEVGSGPGSSGLFERVGQRFASGEDQDEVRIRVLENGYQDVWVPTADGVTSLSFEGDDPKRATDLAEGLRVNQSTATAAVPIGLQAGDEYRLTLTAVSRDEDGWAKEDAAPLSSSPKPYQVDEVQKALEQVLDPEFCNRGQAPTSGDSPYLQVRRIADNLRRCGGLSDGDTDARQTASASGHSAGRLGPMLVDAPALLVGNGEQFAPLAALLSHAAGVPARVVMGFRSTEESDERRVEAGEEPHGDGPYVVQGADVTAWIEVQLEKSGWVPIDDVVPTEEAPAQSPPPREVRTQYDPPPPPPSLPPSEEDLAETSDPCAEQELAAAAQDGDTEATASEADPCAPPPPPPGPLPWFVRVAGLAMLPVALLAAITAAIGGLKARRRQRRRQAEDPVARVDGGWDEIRDLATDMGSPIPDRTTRREGADFIGGDQVRSLAGRADALVFGAGVPAASAVEQYWDQVESTRSAMTADLGAFQRWKVLVSLSSLRAGRRRRHQARRTTRRLQREPAGTSP